MKIAITGANGFIGRQLSNQLGDIFFTESYDFMGDCKNPNALIEQIREGREIDAVLHFGANSDAQEKDFRSNIYQNVGYSNALFSICASTNTPLIFASSAAVYGAGKKSPLSPYARTKLAAEEFMLEMSEIFPYWKCLALRLNNVYGPGEEQKGRMKSIPSRFIEDARNSNLITVWSQVTNLKQNIPSRDFIYVDDLVQIIHILLRELKWDRKVIDVGTGNSTSFIKIAEIIADCLGCDVEITPIPTDINLSYYQLYTCADTRDLFRLIPDLEFSSLENNLTKMIERR